MTVDFNRSDDASTEMYNLTISPLSSNSNSGNVFPGASGVISKVILPTVVLPWDHPRLCSVGTMGPRPSLECRIGKRTCEAYS